MPDKEIKIGDKTIGENTTIVLNLKTLIFIFGLLAAGIAWIYRDIKSEISGITVSLDKLKTEELPGVKTEVGTLRGQVEVVLIMSSRNGTPTVTTITTPIEPDTTIQVTNSAPQ